MGDGEAFGSENVDLAAAAVEVVKMERKQARTGDRWAWGWAAVALVRISEMAKRWLTARLGKGALPRPRLRWPWSTLMQL